MLPKMWKIWSQKVKAEKKYAWFTGGALIGLTSLSIALGSVPMHGRVTDDTALYQSLSEIRVPKTGRLNFDQDIQRLAQLEPQYREKLPSLARRESLRGPMQRIAKRKYRARYRSTQTASRR